MYLYDGPPSRYQYATRVFISDKRATISTNHVFIAGTMTVHNIDIIHGYDINYYDMSREFIVNCEQYLPKYWGKFICMLQRHPPMMGLLSGSTLIVNDKVFAIGAFEIRYNEQRVLVFTDVRYYVDWINIMANISYGEYYDYSYSQWSVKLSAVYDGSGHTNFFPSKYIQYDLWPLGK
ncbi:hypothetical protein O0L34_g2196 [Tuta absoluta]|nr:hypothetical protein O0L34_g2196 [Tuta absoluta]